MTRRLARGKRIAAEIVRRRINARSGRGLCVRLRLISETGRWRRLAGIVLRLMTRRPTIRRRAKIGLALAGILLAGILARTVPLPITLSVSGLGGQRGRLRLIVGRERLLRARRRRRPPRRGLLLRKSRSVILWPPLRMGWRCSRWKSALRPSHLTRPPRSIPA